MADAEVRDFFSGFPEDFEEEEAEEPAADAARAAWLAGGARYANADGGPGHTDRFLSRHCVAHAGELTWRRWDVGAANVGRPQAAPAGADLRFVDLFAGPGTVSHAAAYSGLRPYFCEMDGYPFMACARNAPNGARSMMSVRDCLAGVRAEAAERAAGGARQLFFPRARRS